FLSMWCPPFYVGGCSQAIVTGAEPSLIRNYDYSPRLLEGTWLGYMQCGWEVGMSVCVQSRSVTFGCCTARRPAPI
ncbi:hypothetical protein GFL96_38520, partial [Rhizobium leguminosarum bv. viciae]|nr:hypothetical protein [Rhizobium leguminosarum bv. viciae]